jgi:HSP20 family protein
MSRAVDDFFNDRYRRLINYNSLDNEDITLPAVNVSEDKDAYQLFVAAPGYEKENFNVQIDNGVLLISAVRNATENDDNDGFMVREFNYRSFQRSFSLPEYVDDDQIKAKYENGILKITIPRQPQPEENEAIRRIAVA